VATFTEADAVTYVWRVLRDLGDTATEQLLTDTEVTAFLRVAERRYSIDVPRSVVKDVTADGTMLSPMPTGWEVGFSSMRSIEYPISEQPPSLIDDRRVRVYLQTDGTEKILWLYDQPANLQLFRVSFTASSVVAAAAINTTVPDRHFYAVGDLTASISADAIAGKYAQATDPILNSEVTSYRSKPQEWRDIAKRYEDRYREAVGLGVAGEGPRGGVSGAAGPRPASQIANWDFVPSGRSDWLFHRRATR
jgi:hypothetical protein